MKLLSSTLINPLMSAHCVMQDFNIFLLTWITNKIIWIVWRVVHCAQTDSWCHICPARLHAWQPGSATGALPNRWACDCIWFNVKKVCIQFYTLIDWLITHQPAFAECRCRLVYYFLCGVFHSYSRITFSHSREETKIDWVVLNCIKCTNKKEAAGPDVNPA